MVTSASMSKWQRDIGVCPIRRQRLVKIPAATEIEIQKIWYVLYYVNYFVSLISE